MKYALNIAKGTTINHPRVSLPGLVAVPVDDKVALQVKHIHNVVIFEEIKGVTDKAKSVKKPLYNIDEKTLEDKNGKSSGE